MGRRRFRQQSWDSPAAFAETSVSLQRSTCIPGGASSGAGGYTPERMWPRGQPMLEQAPGRAPQNREEKSPRGAGLLAGMVTLWGTEVEAACSWKAAPHGAAHEKLHPMGRTLFNKCMKCLPWEGPQAGAGKDPPWGGTTCDELTVTPIPCLCCWAGGDRAGK